MKMNANDAQRRQFIKRVGIYGTGLLFGGSVSPDLTQKHLCRSQQYQAIRDMVYQTPMVDAHEHLYPESMRLSGEPMIGRQCNDWTILLNHYLNSDMIVAGMSNDDYQNFFLRILIQSINGNIWLRSGIKLSLLVMLKRFDAPSRSSMK